MTDKNTAALAAHHPENHIDMVEASFEAADMATAAADGFRAGKAACFQPADMATASADGFRDGSACAAAEVAKLKGQRMVLCSLLGECLPVIDALMQMPGDDDSDARLNGLAGRITGALNALAEDQVMGGES